MPAATVLGAVRAGLRRVVPTLLAAALVLGIVAAVAWLDSLPPEEQTQLVAANPGWAIEFRAGWPIATERATQRRIVLSPDHVGPYAIRSVACAEVADAYPAWFRVPGDSSETEPLGCVHLSGDGIDAYVMSFLTAVEAPAVWEEVFQPLVDAASRGYGGGYSSGHGSRLDRTAVLGAAARPPLPGASGPRVGIQLSYRIDAAPESDERETHIAATHVDDETLVVATFRRPRP